MFRLIGLLLLLAGGYGAWVYFQPNTEDITKIIRRYVNAGEFYTLEARFTPEQIMEKQKKHLLKDNTYSYLSPELYFFPYLFMEVKFTNPSNDKTAEGVILWNMSEGEMVIDTASWEETHGFEDCINVGANSTDFRLLNTLAQKGGSMRREELQQFLYADSSAIETWLEAAKKKHLVVQHGEVVRLHFANPKFHVKPQTQVYHWLVTKPYKGNNRLPEKYSERQIRNIASAAFGTDFAVRRAQVVYLPVYSIMVKNPDNSVLTTYWNAINGQKIENTALF